MSRSRLLVGNAVFPTPRDWYNGEDERQFRAQVARELRSVAASISGGPFTDVSKEPYSAKGDGTTNETTIIQAALDDVADAGGGVVYLPVGIYIVSTLTIASNVTLMGAGWGAVLKQLASTTGAVLSLDSVNEEYTVLRDFSIDGNKANQSAANDGIYFTNSGGSFSTGDPIHRISNILVINTKGSGIRLGTEVRETVLSDCHVQRADKYGFRLEMTDSVVIACTTGSSGEHGFWCAAPNSRYIGDKAFGSGRLVVADGFNINQTRQTLSACEAQDNERHGFHLVNASDCILDGCDADSNGTDTLGGAISGYGFRLDTATYNVLSGCLAYNRSGTTPQDYGIDFGTSSSNNNYVQLFARGNTSGTHTGTIGAGSYAIINGAVQTPIASDVYTPALTNVANLSASTAFVCQWSRAGNVVTVTGKVDVDPTGAGATQLGISLPIASNFTANQQAAGTAAAPGIAGQSAAVVADTTNDRAEMQWIAVDTSNQPMFFTFSYLVL